MRRRRRRRPVRGRAPRPTPPPTPAPSVRGTTTVSNRPSPEEVRAAYINRLRSRSSRRGPPGPRRLLAPV